MLTLSQSLPAPARLSFFVLLLCSSCCSRAAAFGTGDIVYFRTYETLIALYTANGSQVWTSPIPWSFGQYPSGIPSLYGQTLYVSNNQTLFSYNAITGKPLWTANLTGIVAFSSMAFGNGMVFAKDASGNICAFNATDGHRLWCNSSVGGMTWTPAVDSSGCSYIQGNYNDAYYGFHKLSPEVGWRGLTASSPVIIMLSSHPKGVILWSTQAHKRMPDDDPDHITPPVFNHDETTVYFASCSYDTVFTQSYTVFAINTATGAHRWSFTPFDLACTAGGEAQIAVGPNGHVYFGAGIDVLIAFSPIGLELWYVDIGDPYDARITSGPVVSHIDGTIYVALVLVGERGLGAIQAYHVDGTLKWMYNTTERGGYVPWAPTIDRRGNVYFSFDDTVYKLDPTGLLVWNYTAPVGPAPDGYFWAGGMIDCECPPPFAATRCLVACQWH